MKCYKTVFQITVLSTDQYPNDETDLTCLESGAQSGDWSVAIERTACDEVSPETFVQLCDEQDILPDFFGLDDDGRPMYCATCGDTILFGPCGCPKSTEEGDSK